MGYLILLGDFMIKKIHVYDMDGTIVCSKHRYRTGPCGTKIDLAHWREHDIAKHIKNDSLLPLAEKYIQDVNNPEIYVVIATARVLKKADYDFIVKHLGIPDKIFGRLPKQTTSGAILKVKWLSIFRQLKQFRDLPMVFFEDNIDYLKKVCNNLDSIGVYIPSQQGY